LGPLDETAATASRDLGTAEQKEQTFGPPKCTRGIRPNDLLSRRDALNGA